MSFFDELKRRNVVRVGIAYVVIGWLLAQVADLAFDAFDAPDWVLKSVLIILLLGLPLALFFAWVFEITPEGVKREKDVDRSRSITSQTGRKLDRIIIGVLVVAVGLLLVDKFYLDESSSTSGEIVATQRQSIAVLPFVNMSDDPDHFSDGLTEELMNLLAKNPDLKVAGRTSSFAFKGETPDFAEIGQALNVEHVLEGSVRRSGDTLRVTAQLIMVEDGYHLWSDTYDREMADIFDIQDDVASSITEELRLRLSPKSDRPTNNAEAYALYVAALALQTYKSPDDLGFAQRLLDQAIKIDPNFAKAYELKSNFHWLESGWTVDGPASQKLAYATAVKALELDPTLIAARSYAETSRPDWRWVFEFDALEELLRIEPDDFNTLDVLTWDMIIAGYFTEAAELAQRMIELEPLAPLGYWRAAEALFAAGRREEAHLVLSRAIEFDEPTAMWMLGTDSLIHGDVESAISQYEKSSQALGFSHDEIRPFIENVRHPETGNAFLDDWVADQLDAVSNLHERRLIYHWYIAFGHLDDYWQSIEALGNDEFLGWDNADTLDQSGMVYRATGFAQHPKYLPRAEATSLVELWDYRGAPDHCSKESGERVCE